LLVYSIPAHHFLLITRNAYSNFSIESNHLSLPLLYANLHCFIAGRAPGSLLSTYGQIQVKGKEAVVWFRFCAELSLRMWAAGGGETKKIAAWEQVQCSEWEAKYDSLTYRGSAVVSPLPGVAIR